jgi:hypothetical protein
VIAASSLVFGVSPLPAQVKVAPKAAVKQDDVEDAFLKQFEAQWGRQLRQVYRSELHLMRVVCQPTKEQYERISADGNAAFKAMTKKLAAGMRRGFVNESSDPRVPISEAISKSVRTTLAPAQAARYQKELDQRATARKRASIAGLVAHVDKVLVLTADQRDKLTKVLETKWNPNWNDTQILMYGGQYFPRMPEAEVVALLTDTQKTIWHGIQKGNINFGFQLNFIDGGGGEVEVWDDGAAPEKSGDTEKKPAHDDNPAKSADKKK